VRYPEALLGAEIEEREHHAVTRRIFEARMPQVKTLEEFDFGKTPTSRQESGNICAADQ
jgi:DNA replication protein DnaC